MDLNQLERKSASMYNVSIESLRKSIFGADDVIKNGSMTSKSIYFKITNHAEMIPLEIKAFNWPHN